MKKKEKKYIAPNEASLGRWIAVLVVGMLFGMVLSIPVTLLLMNKTGTFMGLPYYNMAFDLIFACLFWGLVISLKVVGKTSLKDFILGVGGKLNHKENLTILVLYVFGFVIAYLPFLSNIHLRGVNVGEFGFLVLFMLLTVWMQSTWEELVFRGLLIRWTCNNEIGFTKKAIVVSVITSVVFALSHAGNPEVTSKGGIQAIMALTSYGLTGMLFFFVSLYFGSLMPGIIVHWINNFFLSTIISSEVSVVAVSTLFIDTTPHTGEGMLIGNLLPWLPLLVYIFLDARKKKKAAVMR